jgi:hypothetical protein
VDVAHSIVEMSPPLPERYLPKSIRTNAQLLKGRSRVRVGDIFDIISKGYS